MMVSEPGQPAANSKALRYAATMMLLRDGAGGLEVFMVERHRQIEFSSGALVFPGGSVDAADYVLASQNQFFHAPEGLDADALSLRIAAVRETFEESGHLLARVRGSDAIVSADRTRAIEERHRIAVAEGSEPFADLLASEGLVLALDLLVPFAHWITPVKLPKRFDTHFFIAAVPRDQVGSHDGKELVDSLWVSPSAAIEGSDAGRFKIVFPTMRNLIKLNRYGSVGAALSGARETPVVTVMPEFVQNGDRRQLRIPAAAGYDGEVFDFDT